MLPASGLSSDDYNADGLAAAVRGDAIAAATDVALTEAMLHFLADLKVGRVRSEYHTTLPDPRLSAFDPVEQLRAALAQNRLLGRRGCGPAERVPVQEGQGLAGPLPRTGQAGGNALAAAGSEDQGRGRQALPARGLAAPAPGLAGRLACRRRAHAGRRVQQAAGGRRAQVPDAQWPDR
ncbi:hypothetical protein LP419_36000 [Massilia sp. H-1]|nr:hypothetical protein LP419_36000 [Massilia sp. H-1]